MISIPLAFVRPWGILDRADVDGTGLVRLVGWSQSAEVPVPALRIDAWPIAHLATYRFPRPDVPAAGDRLLPQTGVMFEYRLEGAPFGEAVMLGELRIDERSWPLERSFVRQVMHYDELLETDRVLGRDEIYGHGPPSPIVAPDVLELLSGVSGRVLDFGCGSGALVAALRARGVDAVGLEIDRPAIREALLPEAAPHVTLYDGGLPSPFEAGAYDVVTCIEVLEHIPDHEAALAELARLTRGKLVMTVPDISVVPLGTPHGLVPWHLLEATHLHFFTQRSLTRLLAQHFPRIEIGRVSPAWMNGLMFHTSLAAVCER